MLKHPAMDVLTVSIASLAACQTAWCSAEERLTTPSDAPPVEGGISGGRGPWSP